MPLVVRAPAWVRHQPGACDRRSLHVNMGFAITLLARATSATVTHGCNDCCTNSYFSEIDRQRRTRQSTHQTISHVQIFTPKSSTARKGELARLPIMPALLGTKPPLNDRQTTLAKARVLASLWHRVILRRLSATRGGSRLPTTAVPTSGSIPTSAQRLGLLYHSPNWLRVSSPTGSCSRIDFGFSLALF